MEPQSVQTGAETLAGGTWNFLEQVQTELASLVLEVWQLSLRQEPNSFQKELEHYLQEHKSLNSGLGTLSAGASQVSEGSAALSTNMKTANAGAQSVASGASQLASGASQLNSGAGTLSTGLNTLQSSTARIGIRC